MTGAGEGGGDAPLAPAAATAPPIVAWLRAMERCVRERDFASARDLFAGDVVAFGTLQPRADGLAALERHQWRPIWTTTAGFRFELGSAWVESSGRLAYVAVRWSSSGTDADGDALERRGRATLVLDVAGAKPICIHSHFSLDPSR